MGGLLELMPAFDLLPLEIPPGVFRNGTEYESRGRWWDVNLVRWFAGRIRPVGGWQSAFDTVLDGVCRSGLSWRKNDGARRTVFGTTEKLYAWNGGSLDDITPAGFSTGREDAVTGFGYGTGPYGVGPYGTQRTTGTPLGPTTWSFDLWGENLVGVASHEGTIYEWDTVPANAAAAVSNAPTADALVVTPERALVALGADGDPRKVEWSDREDNTDWTPSATNAAGGQALPTLGVLQSGHRTIGGAVLLLTTADAFLMTFAGGNTVYGFRKAGNDCGVVGQLAASEFDGRVAWMGRRNFWLFDGSVRPIPCEVADYVFDDINRTQIEKVHTAHLPRFGEIWWFYPSGSSDEIDRYVIWNYRENHWSIGQLDRTAWVEDNGVWDHPFGVDSAGNVYEQETGFTADGASRDDDVYAQSGPVEIGPGGQTLWVNQMIASEETVGQVAVEIRSRFTPNGAETTHGPFTIADGEYVDMRLQGRQVSVRIEQAEDEDWRWGTPRLRARAGSGR